MRLTIEATSGSAASAPVLVEKVKIGSTRMASVRVRMRLKGFTSSRENSKTFIARLYDRPPLIRQ
jgi:predicted aspartyl protease